MPLQHFPSGALKLLLKHSLFQLLIEQLRDRLFHAQGDNVGDQQPPPFPYTRVSVGVIKPPAAKGGSTLEGAAHKAGPRHPEKVGLKLRCSWLGRREEGYWVVEGIWSNMRWHKLQTLRNSSVMSFTGANISFVIIWKGAVWHLFTKPCPTRSP